MKLGDLCHVITKGTTPTSVGFKFENDGVNFVKVESLTSNNGFIPAKFAKISSECNESLKRSQLQKGDILFSIAGALGRTAIVTEDILPANTNQALAIIRLKPNIEIDTRYLLHTLNSDTTKEQSERNKGGVAQQNLSLTQLKNYDVYLPPLPEQQRIVAKLDAAFAEIDEAIEVAVAKEAEVQKLRASLLSLSLNGDAVMWKAVKLEDLFKIGSSKRVLKAEWKEAGVPFYRGREITTLSKTGIVDNDLFISEEHFSTLKAKYGVPQQGDLLVTAIGTIGNTYIVREKDRFYFKDASVLWLHKVSDVDSRFVNYWFNSHLFYEQLEAGNGATVDTLSISKLKAMNFLLPPLAEQERIVAKLDAAYSEFKNANESIAESKVNYLALKSAILEQELQSSEAA